MTHRFRLAVLLGSIVQLAAVAAPAAESNGSSLPTIDPIVVRLSAPMMAVAHLVVVEKYSAVSSAVDDIEHASTC